MHTPISDYHRYKLLSRNSPKALEPGPRVDEDGIPSGHQDVSKLQLRMSRWWYKDEVPPITAEDLEAAHGEHH